MVAKLVSAKVVRYKTLSKEVKILSIDHRECKESRVSKSIIVKIYVVKNVHLRSSISAAFANYLRTDVEVKYLLKVVSFVVV